MGGISFRSILIKDQDYAMDTNTFHPFPRLPVEIRQKIWRATFVPRIRKTGVVADAPGQPLLPLAALVNKEARAEVLRNYHEFEESVFTRDKLDYARGYINYSLDTLAIHHPRFPCRMPKRMDKLETVMLLRSPPLVVPDQMLQEWREEPVASLHESVQEAMPKLREVWNCLPAYQTAWCMFDWPWFSHNQPGEEMLSGRHAPNPVQFGPCNVV